MTTPNQPGTFSQVGSNVPQTANAPGPDQTSISTSPLVNSGVNFTPYAIQPSGAAMTNDITQPNINALVQPPTLGTFVYSPNVRVVIANGGIEYDGSADFVSGRLIREEKSAATFIFTLQNSGLRYTPPGLPPLFDRMDRIVVYLFWTAWVQALAGFDEHLRTQN